VIDWTILEWFHATNQMEMIDLTVVKFKYNFMIWFVSSINYTHLFVTKAKQT